MADGSIQFDGTTPIDEAADILDRSSLAENGEYTTVAGFVLWRLGHIPQANEAFEWEGWRFVVVALDGHRIETIVAQQIPEQP
jgi:putative hemolysin